ncbi:MAG: S66 peptidase family protein [Brevinema sp.]
MLIGKKISKGSCIGIVALSSSQLDLEMISQGSKYLEKLGYKVILPPQIYQNTHFFPGTPKERASALNDLFLNPDVDMIMALRGGFGGIQILPYIDYDLIKKNPKVFVGYSDLTSVQNVLFQKTNLVSFHGPMLTSNFAQQHHTKSTDESLFSLLSGMRIKLATDIHILSNPQSTQKIQGTLLGGNLITFMTLMGTGYQPNLQGSILFFEDIDEKTYSIDRALTQLLLTPQISEVKAFVFGDFNHCLRRNTYELELFELIKERLEPLGIPIITDIPSGHCSPMMTFPIGAKIEIDLEAHHIRVLNEVVH